MIRIVYTAKAIFLGRELQRLRESVGLTLEDAAMRIDYDPFLIEQIEAGEIEVGLLRARQMCGVYAADFADLALFVNEFKWPTDQLPSAK